jgi:adenine-specific DNA methylase
MCEKKFSESVCDKLFHCSLFENRRFEKGRLNEDFFFLAKLLFEDLINSLQTKLIVVSYNNTYDAKSSSSNNTILPEEILTILKKRGGVVVKEKDYKSFNAGKTDLSGHKEILYICEVKNED